MAAKDMGEFQGAQIDYAEAYHEARRLMGLRTTDMELLHYNTMLLYLNAPATWSDAYLHLTDEIQTRINMIELMKMGVL